MVLEIAHFTVTPGSADAFASDYRQARALLARSPGCGQVRMTRGVESPNRFVLLVEWGSVADHEAFRASADFPAWRALIGPHFAAPPQVEHYTDV